MLSNYLKIAVRNLRRHKSYSFVNIAGLSIGIGACVMMLLYVQDEFTYDTFNAKADRIYRLVETSQSVDQGLRHFPFVMGPLGPAMEEQLPEVAQVVRFRDRAGLGRFTVHFKDHRFYEGSYLTADPKFFQVFDFTFLEGDPATALSAPNSVVLTESAARKYFGTEDPMGKTLSVERYGDSKVTGLIQDPPSNSHLQFSMVFSWFGMIETNPRWKEYMHAWDSDYFITYVVTSPGVGPKELDQKIASLINGHRQSLDRQLVSVTAQPLIDVHFGSGDIEFDRNAGKKDLTSVLVFAAIAILILLVACINYVNLATARGMKRAREIGVRKVTGARQWQLIAQLLGESILLSLAGLAFALLLVEILLPPFNALAGKSLALNLVADPLVLFGLVVLAVLVGVFSGVYPSLLLARMNPVSMLKSQPGTPGSTGMMRRVLVVVQFALTIVMIVATVVAQRQLSYVNQKNLGFEKDHLLVVDINSGNTRRSFETIKAKMAALPQVKSVSASSRVPGEWKNIAEIKVLAAGAAPDQAHTMSFICIDTDFLNTFGMNLLAGRNFSGSSPADTSSVIINEAAARALGWKDAVGKEISVPGKEYRARVIGVVKDFNFRSLHEPVGPLVLGYWDNPVTAIDYFSLRFQTADIGGLLASLEGIHREFDTVTPLEYNFLDDRIDDFYRDDSRTGEVFTVAAILSIVVALLGLIGLVSFITEQRTKEIGVRKVLGATVPNILMLLWKDFVVLVGAATAIGSPIAYFALRMWLENFAYRVDVSWWIFLFAGLLTLVLALLTVSIQTLKAAVANPVEALRYE